MQTLCPETSTQMLCARRGIACVYVLLVLRVFSQGQKIKKVQGEDDSAEINPCWCISSCCSKCIDTTNMKTHFDQQYTFPHPICVHALHLSHIFLYLDCSIPTAVSLWYFHVSSGSDEWLRLKWSSVHEWMFYAWHRGICNLCIWWAKTALTSWHSCLQRRLCSSWFLHFYDNEYGVVYVCVWCNMLG